MSAPVDSLHVMAYIVQRCEEMAIPVNTTKLQKLMYCCYGACLGRFNYRICDESPEAWEYGPVFPRTLKVLQTHGVDYFRLKSSEIVNRDFPRPVKDLINSALRTFGSLAPNQLVNWTRSRGSPWDATSSGGKLLREQIPDGNIRRHFQTHVLAQRDPDFAQQVKGDIGHDEKQAHLDCITNAT